jgi:hypothetical protein
MVYDKILFGLGNNLLGVFTIDLKSVISKSKILMNKDIKLTSKKVGISTVTNILGKNLNDLNEIEKRIEEIEQSSREQELKLFQNVNKLDENKDNVAIENNVNNMNEDKESKLNLVEQNKDSKNTDKNNDKNLEMNNQEKKLDQNTIITNNENENKIENKDKDKDKLNEKNTKILANMFKKVDEPMIIYPEFIQEEITYEKNIKLKYHKEVTVISDKKKYFELGFENPNNVNSTSKKHYRRIFNCELENEEKLKIKSPFYKLQIKRDKYQDIKDVNDVFTQLRSNKRIIKRVSKIDKDHDNLEMEDEFSVYRKEDQIETSYGYFKGLILCMEYDKKKEFLQTIENIKKNNPALLDDFKHFNKYSDLSKSIQIKRELSVRLYILELRDLVKKDLFSESDPYIKIKLGNQVIDEQKNYLTDQSNAMLYKVYK